MTVGKWFGFAEDEIYEEARRAFESGDFDLAIEAFTACQESASGPAMVRLTKHYLAESYSHAGAQHLREEAYRAALDDFEQALALWPNYADLRLGLAYAFRGLGDARREEAELDRALEMNPDYAEALLAKGALLYERGDQAAALETLERATALEPRLATEGYREALALHAAGNANAASLALAKLGGAEANEANQIAAKAASLEKGRRRPEAKSLYAQAIALAPGYADLRCRYGQLLLEMDEIEEAAEQLRRAVELNERYVDAVASLGLALSRLGRSIEAGDCFERALALDPYHPVASAEAAKTPGRRSLR